MNGDKLNPVYNFGAFRFDTQKLSLMSGNMPVKLGSKALRVLEALIEKAGTTVSKEELLIRVWGSAVEVNNVDQCVYSIRKAIADPVDDSKYIKTVSNEGYRFIAPIGTDSIRPRKRVRRILLVGLSLLGLTIVAAVVAGLRKTNPKIRLSTSSVEARAYYYKGLEYARVGDDEQALSTFDQAISTDPNFAEAYLEKASVYYDVGERRKASDELEKIGKLSVHLGSSFQPRFEGLRYEVNGDLDSALKKYQLLVDMYPEDPDSYIYFSTVAMDSNRLDEANSALRRCVQLDPQNPYCYYNLMYLQLKSNNFDTVLGSYDSLRTKGITYPWFEELVGVAFWGKGQLEEARKHFQLLSKARAGFTRVHGHVHSQATKEWEADLLFYQGQAAAGQKIFDELIDESPATERASHLLYIARVQAVLGNTGPAKSSVLEAIKMTQDPMVLSAAAEVLATLRADRDALQALAAARRLVDPSVAGNILKADHFVRGYAAMASGNNQVAIDELSLASERNGDMDAEYALAHAYMRARKCENAVPLLEKITTSKGEIFLEDVPAIVPLAHYDLGICYEQAGLTQRALQSYSEFLSIWKNADSRFVEVSSATQRLAELQRRAN